ncbi:MAG: lasso peptide biosynthesis B2 protein [Anaerolineales bacterium]|nr:lasso peptide biosynthesis B2 protein [Anaerolineales bacterium]
MHWSKRIARARYWSGHDWRGLWQGWMALLWAAWQLRRQPLPDLLAALQRQPVSAHPAPPTELVQGVQRAAHLFPRPMLCLPQSIAIARLLSQQGQPYAFLLGAQPKDETLAAHAWIEIEGIPINSPPDSAQRHPVLLEQAIPAGETGLR